MKNFQKSIRSLKLRIGNQCLTKNFQIQCLFKWYHAWGHTRKSTINFKTQNLLKKSSVLCSVVDSVDSSPSNLNSTFHLSCNDRQVFSIDTVFWFLVTISISHKISIDVRFLYMFLQRGNKSSTGMISGKKCQFTG